MVAPQSHSTLSNQSKGVKLFVVSYHDGGKDFWSGQTLSKKDDATLGAIHFEVVFARNALGTGKLGAITCLR